MRYYFAMLLNCFILGLSSCADSDESVSVFPSAIPVQIQDAFLKRYPDATNISWQSKGKYAIARFSLPLTRSSNLSTNSAWLDLGAKWHMTEANIPFCTLPRPVQMAFTTGEYASWNVDDVESIERQGMEVIYIIQVDGIIQGKRAEIDLYYAADGVFVKKVVDSASNNDYEELIPSTPANSINEYLKSHYPNARIIEIDSEDGLTEIELLDGGMRRTLFFDRSSIWCYTKTEVWVPNIPDKVMEALRNSEYSSYRIEDIDYYQTPGRSYYRFDLESSKGDIKIDITLEGILNASKPGQDSDDTGNASMLPQVVKNFISNKYPESSILEYENENGFLEVEIFHASCQKDVYFNGSNSWVMSKWDVRLTELPVAVLATIETSEYASYEVDDIEYVQEPSQEYYGLELERGDSEVYLCVDRRGKIIK